MVSSCRGLSQVIPTSSEVRHTSVEAVVSSARGERCFWPTGTSLKPSSKLFASVFSYLALFRQLRSLRGSAQLMPNDEICSCV